MSSGAYRTNRQNGGIFRVKPDLEDLLKEDETKDSGALLSDEGVREEYRKFLYKEGLTEDDVAYPEFKKAIETEKNVRLEIERLRSGSRLTPEEFQASFRQQFEELKRKRGGRD